MTENESRDNNPPQVGEIYKGNPRNKGWHFFQKDRESHPYVVERPFERQGSSAGGKSSKPVKPDIVVEGRKQHTVPGTATSLRRKFLHKFRLVTDDGDETVTDLLF